MIHWKPCRHISQHRVRSISFRKLSAYFSSCSILIFFHASSKFFLSLGWLAACLMGGKTALWVELGWFNSDFSIWCTMGSTEAKGVDLYDGGTGDIRPRLSMSEVKESGTGLSALVAEGIEKSKSFEVLTLFSGLFTKGLRFESRFIGWPSNRGDSWESSSEMWSTRSTTTGVSNRRGSRSSVTDSKVWDVCATERRFTAGRSDIDDSWELLSSKMWSIRSAGTGVSDRRDSSSSVTDLKVWYVGATEYC